MPRLHVYLAIVVIALSAPQANAAIYFQGFETDAAGWFDFGGTITRVPSGTGGVTSAAGAFHGVVTTGAGTGDGAYTNFGGYSSVWPGGIRQSLDVYIDPAVGAIGDGWFLDNAVNDNTGVWEEAGGVGAEKTASGTWSIGADADGGGYLGGGIDITKAGWYTIVSDWAANGDGLTVDRNTFIYDSGGALLYSDFNPAQVSLANIGGWRYGWLARSTGNGLEIPIDNSQLDVVPEPATLAVWSLLGLTAVGAGCWRRHRRSR